MRGEFHSVLLPLSRSELTLVLDYRLFKSYFEEEQDPAAHEILARDAETAGIMSKSEALEFLKSDELSKEVQEGIKKAQLRGISGVSTRFHLLKSRGNSTE